MLKINDLKSSITAKLSAISTLGFSDPPHFGPLFRNIHPVSATEIHRILASCPAKASSADCIPLSIIKACPNLFSELIADLANRSFREGILVVTSTGSGPTFRGVRLLDESIFSLLIGLPDEVTNIPAQISARGHRASPFSEMNSSKDRLTSSPRPLPTAH